MKTSWQQCVTFSNVAQAYLKGTKQAETKLSYAINRVLSRIQKHQATVSEALSDIEIDHCVTEKRGDAEVICRDAQGNLQYTREGMKERNKKTREYLNSDNIEIEPYFATSLPDDLTVFEVEAFKDFVINEIDAERLLREDEAKAGTTEAAPNGHQPQIAALSAR